MITPSLVAHVLQYPPPPTRTALGKFHSIFTIAKLGKFHSIFTNCKMRHSTIQNFAIGACYYSIATIKACYYSNTSKEACHCSNISNETCCYSKSSNEASNENSSMPQCNENSSINAGNRIVACPIRTENFEYS